MKHQRLLLMGALALSAAGVTSIAFVSRWPKQEASAALDPRTAPLLVKVVERDERGRR